MALPAVGDAAYPTPNEIRDKILQSIKLGFSRIGLTANILPGSEHYIRVDGVSKRLSIAFANLALGLADFSPLDATGDALVRLAGVFGVTKRAASKATGYVVISVTTGISVTIPAGFQCTAPNGQTYTTVSIATAVVSGASVQVRAVTGGADGDQDADTILSWDLASIGHLKPTCVVDSGELDGGADEDDEETLRQRLIDRLSFPAIGGNAAQVKAWAEEASASVEKAYVYPAVRGAGSYDVAITAEGGDRTLSAATVAAVNGYVLGKMPGPMGLNTTSVLNQGVDVILTAVLALPVNAGGAGGGWRDASPWPSAAYVTGVTDGKITAYASPTATVRETAAPLVGTHIGIWDTGELEMLEYELASVTTPGAGGAGTHDFTVVGGFSVTPLNAYVSAGAINLVSYASEFLDGVLLLGPGEKTASTDILPRGRRNPGTDVSNPSDLTAQLLNPIMTGHEEVGDMAYAARYAVGTTTLKTSPSVPATTADPPRILTLFRLAIRKA